jgi:N-acetyl-anhydromuramyl-L-alanine amidase AmpD
MESMADYLLPIMKRYNLALRDVTDHRTVSPGRKDDLAMSEFARFKDYLGKRLI